MGGIQCHHTPKKGQAIPREDSVDVSIILVSDYPKRIAGRLELVQEVGTARLAISYSRFTGNGYKAVPVACSLRSH